VVFGWVGRAKEEKGEDERVLWVVRGEEKAGIRCETKGGEMLGNFDDDGEHEKIRVIYEMVCFGS